MDCAGATLRWLDSNGAPLDSIPVPGVGSAS